ncbi:transmembrane protein 59-like isoform X5 [Calypte anna]|uniref:transmembrane protein 59-like isoform X5 n=1 Tax=Calypte anna TaxID=9244 RepID=UPI0011C38905|nr:transmembrane protein 59-like isoform X5 [Calypte anna]
MAARSPRALLAIGLALLATAATAATTIDPFSSQLGDTAGCRGQCGRSLPRRAAADAVLNACYRGCRLFSICHFVDASAELNTTRAECEAACAEAYSNAEEQFGCVSGCHKQLPEVESRKEKVRGGESPALKDPTFSMLDLVSTFCNDIVSSAQSFISSTWTFYLQADDGKVVVFQSQPEVEYPVPEVQETLLEQPGLGSSPRVPQPHTASEHQRGQGVPGGPGWPRCLPPATRHRCHPLPHAWHRGRGATAPQGGPGQDHPVALLPLPITSMPPPCHCPHSIVPIPAPLPLQPPHVHSSSRDTSGSVLVGTWGHHPKEAPRSWALPLPPP